jgi:hypothetical protein
MKAVGVICFWAGIALVGYDQGILTAVGLFLAFGGFRELLREEKGSE